MTTRRAVRWSLLVLAIVLATAIPRSSGQEASPPAVPSEAEPRTWTDITGKFSREGVFLKLEDGKVHLRLSSGKETRIPLKELSKKDRDWVRANGAPKGIAAGSGADGGKGVASRIVLRSYKTMVDDSVWLAEALGQPALAGAVPGFFVALTGGKPLDGFDISKPIVITSHVDSRGQPSGTMVAVPVSGKDRFQNTLDGVFAGQTTPKGKSYQIPMLQKSVWVKPGESYFLLSDSPDVIRSAAADPPAPVAVADVAIESMVGAVPEDLRMAGLAQFEAMMDSVPVPPGAPEGQRRSQEVTSAWVKNAVRGFVADGDRQTFEASIDPTTKRTSLSIGLRARGGTPLAGTFAAYGAIRPGFLAAGDADALGWIGISTPAGEWTKMALETVLGEGIRGMKEAAARAGGPALPPDAQAVLDGIEKATQRIMATEHIEQEIVFQGDASGKPRLLARVAADGARDLVAALSKLGGVDPAGPPPPDADGILSMPVPAGAPDSMGLLDHPVRVAASNEAMVIGFGCPDTAAVKAMMAARSTGPAAAPLSARVDLARLWPMIAAMNPATAALGDAVGQEGMVKADVNALTDGIEVRLNADAGAVRLLGALAGVIAAQAQAGPGLPGFPGGPPPGVPGPGGPAAGGVPKRRPGPPGFPSPDGGAPPTIQGFPTPPIPQSGQPAAPAPNQVAPPEP